MTVTRNRPMTLQEYLDYEDGTENAYELIDGILVETGAEADINIVIAGFLASVFLQFFPHYCIRRGTELVVEGQRANTRIPDLTILSEEGVAVLAGQKRSVVMLEMPAPLLVIEVVSNSVSNKESRDRDYVSKRQEYARRAIEEYWIVDPVEAVVLVLNLQEGRYKERLFKGDDSITSLVLPDLKLSAQQILDGGM